MPRSIALAALLAFGTMLAFSSWLPTNDAASAGQGKGGVVIAKPTPTAKKPPTKPPTKISTTKSAKSAKLTEIDRRLAELKKKRNALLVTHTAEWPEVKELDAQINSLERQRDALLGKTTGTAKAGASVRNQIGMELVWIPPGSFMMGSENGQADEKPVHRVTLVVTEAT